MEVHTTYYPAEERWGWSLYEDNVFVEICTELYDTEKEAWEAGVEAILNHY